MALGRVLSRTSALTLLGLTCATGGCFGSDSGGGPQDGSPVFDGPSEGGAAPDGPSPDSSVDATPSGPEASVDAGGADSSPVDSAQLDVGAAESGSDATDGGAEASVSTTPVQLGSSIIGDFYGAASADGSAMLLIAWASSLRFSHYEPATGWSAPAPVPGSTNALLGTNAMTPVGIDANGNAYATWLVNEPTDAGGNHYVYAVTRYDHATQAWGAVQFPDTTGLSLQDPAMSVNSGGEVLLVAPPDPNFNTGTLVAEHYSGGASGSWTQESILSTSSSWGQPYVSLADSGAAVLALTGGVIATRSGATWTQAPVSSSPPFVNEFVAVAANAAGDVLVADGENSQGGAPVVYQYDATKMTWSGPKVLSTETETAAGQCNYAVGLAATGDAVLARCWDGLAGSSPTTIEAYTFTKSTDTWSMPATAQVTRTTPDGGMTGNAGAVWIALNPSGSGVAAYIDNGRFGSTSAGPLESNLYSRSTGWGAQSLPESADGGALSGAAGNNVAPFVSPTGAAWVAWYDGILGNSFVRRVN